MFTVPPATTVRTGPTPTSAEVEEVRQKLPGMLDVLEVDHPGMHRTDSVDFDHCADLFHSIDLLTLR